MIYLNMQTDVSAYALIEAVFDSDPFDVAQTMYEFFKGTKGLSSEDFQDILDSFTAPEREEIVAGVKYVLENLKENA